MKLKSLRSRIAAHVALLVAGSLLIGVVAAGGILSLHEDLGVAMRGYRVLREVYEIGVHITTARQAPTRESAGQAIDDAIIQLESPEQFIRQGDVPARWMDDATCDECLTALRLAKRDPTSPQARAALNRVLSEVATISSRVRSDISAHEFAAEHDRRVALIFVSLFSAGVIVVGAFVGTRLYRSVMRPLDRVSHGVRGFASGKLEHRLSTQADDEFAALAHDFNTMAAELQSLYADLEARVQTKSRELVQAERLASVGYLAAGVAHEINNPLGIIAGYGERSLQRLNRPGDADVSDYIRNAIGVMCDEAFRCKKITDRLLMLARPGDDARRIVSIFHLASEVVTLLGGLERFSDRRITLEASPVEKFSVFGNEGELRQVLLNLLVNALESFTPGQAAHVHVAVFRELDQIEITVRDNGRGMSSEVLTRIFEPFFTEKRGERAGTGLGLALAHSIVTDHEGHIDAHSDGLGAGSTFVVRLPAYVSEDAHAAAH